MTTSLIYLWFILAGTFAGFCAGMFGVGGLIGAIPSLFGIGGGSMTVPFLNKVGLAMQQSVGTFVGVKTLWMAIGY